MSVDRTAPDHHYAIISADTHAGGSHAQYREYLDPAYVEEFDAWRAKYRNPFRDLAPGEDRRLRNWDNDMRVRQQEADGITAEVVFPNTVPPFFPSFVLFAPQPTVQDYARRRAGIHAHNRWLVDFCGGPYTAQRAGIGQIFLNDVDDAIEDTRWIVDHGLRGGLLLPNIPIDATWIKPLHDPCYDPLWEVCQDLQVPINVHGGAGTPNFGSGPAADLLFIAETSFYSKRPLTQLVLSGVFERFPRLKVVMTEQGCSWVPPALAALDTLLERIRTGKTGELRYSKEHLLPRSATDYFRQNVWLGVSFPSPSDAAAFEQVGLDRCMWGSDYPHDEATYPYSREHLRQVFHDAEPATMNKVLTDNAAAVYGFDLDVLQPIADRVGPTVAEVQQPLTELPAEPNEALLRGAAVA